MERSSLRKKIIEEYAGPLLFKRLLLAGAAAIYFISGYIGAAGLRLEGAESARIAIGAFLAISLIFSVSLDYFKNKINLLLYFAVFIVTAHLLYLNYLNNFALLGAALLITVVWGGGLLMKSPRIAAAYNMMYFLAVLYLAFFTNGGHAPLAITISMLLPALVSIVSASANRAVEKKLNKRNGELSRINIHSRRTEEHLIKLNKDLFLANEKANDNQEHLKKLNKELEEANKMARESNNRFSTIFHSSPVAFALVSFRDGRFIDGNLSFFALFLLNRTDVVRKNFSELPVWNGPDGVAAVFSILKKNMRISNLEIEMKNKAGEPISALLMAEVIELDGESVILCSIQDISERKESEERALKAKEAADSANKLKSEFLANISHEIRTPLNSVIGFSELLASRIADEKNRKFVDGITSSGKNLLALINDILDLSKIEAGKLELNYDAANIRNIVEDAGKIFALKMEEKNLGFNINISGKSPESLILDETRLRQILVNLIGNSVKFTDKGFVQVSVYPYKEYKGGRKIDLMIEVQDTGIGINASQQSLIFEAFRQQNGQRHGKYGGTGLGLAITKRLAELMGGSVSVESEPGNGSFFRIFLPGLEVPALKEIKSPKKESGISRNIEFAPATILAVDDNEMNRLLIREYFKGTNLKIAEVEGGREAIKFLAYQQPGLIIMGLRMHGISGYEAAENIRRNNPESRLPIIAISAAPIKHEREKLEAAGFDSVLIKPFSKESLFREIMKYLEYKEIERPAGIFKQRKTQIQPAGHTEKFGELSMILKSELLETKKGLSKTLMIGQIKEFSLKLRMLAEQYECSPLNKYSERLFINCDKLALDDIIENLEEYGNVVQEIEDMSTQRPAANTCANT